MKINIVSFSIPFPADYGGAIDVFYKIKALHEKGIGIILHCFEYNRLPNNYLEKYCDKVIYYKRNLSLLKHLSKNPFIVESRRIPELKANLIQYNYPILFEGIHTTAFLDEPDLKNRIKIVRMHNVESEYYKSISISENSFLKKAYLFLEANKLKLYEKHLIYADHLLVISKNDYQKSRVLYKEKVKLIPAFHAFNGKIGSEGKGDYILYHGDLSISENLKGLYLIIKHYSKKKWQLPLFIAGLNPPHELRKMVVQHNNLRLIANPSESEMADLIRNAHINLIYSSNISGMKLKLIHALILGRFCVVNVDLANASEMSECCHVFTNFRALSSTISYLVDQEFKFSDHQDRYQRLNSDFSNDQNACKIIDLLNESDEV